MVVQGHEQPHHQRYPRECVDVYRRGHARALSGAFIAKVNSPIDEHVFAQNERVRAVGEQVIPAHALGPMTSARQRADGVLGGMVDRGIARFATGEVELNDETYAAWLAELKVAGSDELIALYKGL